MKLLWLIVLSFAITACANDDTPGTADLPMLPAGVEAISLLGDTLRAPPLAGEARADREARWEAARAAYDAAPDDADSIIWLGRRTAYLGRYRDAVRHFTEGIRKHPNDARMYRHRGHRYLTLREFTNAIADFERAAALVEGQADVTEPDGLPNARNIPTSTLQSNIWYHLGLAHYVRGDYDAALGAYREGMAVSLNDDMRVATAYWYYLTLRRLGRDAEAEEVLAPIDDAMDIIENQTYQQLLLLFKGDIEPATVLDVSGDPDAALANVTAGYGVGAWYALSGNGEEAARVWRQVLATTQWAGFGYIAAEAEIRRATGEGG